MELFILLCLRYLIRIYFTQLIALPGSILWFVLKPSFSCGKTSYITCEKILRKTIIKEPLNNIWRQGSQNCMEKSDYNFYKAVKDEKVFPAISHIVTFRLIFEIYYKFASLIKIVN